jgi:hypothetical protein
VRNLLFVMLSLMLVVTASGCVERTVTIVTDPPGAIVVLDGELAGKSPVTVPFRHYGNHAICLKLDGYMTVLGSIRLRSPWYQKPGIDFFSENVYPATLVVERSATFTLVKVEQADPDEAEREAAAMKVRFEEFLRKAKQGKDVAKD